MKRLSISFCQFYLEPGAAYGFSGSLLSELQRRLSRKSLPSEKIQKKYPGAERLDFSLSASSKIMEGNLRATEYHRSNKEVECYLTLTFSAGDRSWKRRSASGLKSLVSCVETVFANFELEVPASWNKTEILEFYLQAPERCVDPVGRSQERPKRLSEKTAANAGTPKNWDVPTKNADDEHDPFNNPRQRSSPTFFTARMKGRLQHALRVAGTPTTFSRKVAFRTIGENRREQVEAYIDGQVSKEQFVDVRFEEFMKGFTVSNADVRLQDPAETERGRYWYNLHVVLVTESRILFTDGGSLRLLAGTCDKVAIKKSYGISRRSVMPDHIHLSLRGDVAHSPEDVALSFMNNIAFAFGQKAIFRPSYYVGTFGEYDMGAVR